MKKAQSEGELAEVTARTLAHYDRSARSFAEATFAHDVSQNYAALLDALRTKPPYRLLDLGCGPGRDLAWFKLQGHEVEGLDGSSAFVEMARKATGCVVHHQNFLQLELAPARYDGIFANASLFHVPTRELPRVLGELHDALVPGGVLFSSNPRGDDSEGWNGDRYGAFHTFESWRAYLERARFTEVLHYYRPTGRPRAEQPWLASVWRK